MTDLAFSLVLTAATLVVAVAYAGRVSRVGAAKHSRIERAGISPLLGKSAMEMGYWAMRPAARVLIALGVSANGVSWASLGLAILAGFAFGAGAFGVGAALSLLSSACDGLDGMIARETGTASESGEVLDAAVDRYAELFAFGGIAYFERFDGFMLVLTLAAAAGAVMVSYSTAKAEALQVTAPRGALRRQERAVYLVVGTALVPIAAAACARATLPLWIARAPLVAVLAIVAIVGNASAARRLRAVAEAVRKPEPLRAQPPDGANRLAREHAATGDAVR